MPLPRKLGRALRISVHWHRQAEMLAERRPGIFPTKDAALLQFRNDRIDELIEGDGEVRRHQYEAVASALDKPFLHDIGDHGCVPAYKEVSAGHGHSIVKVPQREVRLASL